MTAVFYHSELSNAEGYPGIIRVITPKYLTYIEGDDTYSTNYTATVNGESNITVEVDVTEDQTLPNYHTFDFKFNGGITYNDFIGLNFTMTVAPELVRDVGSGVETSSVILLPVCERVVFSGYPEDAAGDPYEHQTQCGTHVFARFASKAPGQAYFREIKNIKWANDLFKNPFFAKTDCFGTVSITDDKCVWGSSQYSTDYSPFESLSDDSGNNNSLS